MGSQSSGSNQEQPSHPGERSTRTYVGDTPRIIANRYQLGQLLGAGGGGQVYRATDLLDKREVAVKLLIASFDDAELRRARREVGALCQLRMPGVVRLHDYGLHSDTPYISMEIVDGTPFPGNRPADWESIRETAEALLETLARVHATGLIHRDLKPSNVLVDDAGRPTILDFGLTWGPSLGRRFTSVGRVVGTPHCLAPEQVANKTLDARTDLYAVGVMLYETLSGKLPHSADNLQELMHLKLAQTPEPLTRVAPNVPPRVARVVDALLSSQPDQRPPSAAAALQQLSGEPTTVAPVQLPRVGQAAALARVLSAVSERRSIDIVGDAGMGRSRMLTDVAEHAQREGRRVLWSTSGERPLSSLSTVLTGFDDLRSADLKEVLDRAYSELCRKLQGGSVLFVDDSEQVDQWSAATIERVRHDRCVVRACLSTSEHADADSATGAVITLEPVTEIELRELFVGPDLLVHLREDPAAELHRRTYGVPSRFVDELAAWLRWDIATWDGDRIRVDRMDIDRLRSGLAMSPLAFRVDLAAPQLDAFHDDLLAWVQFAAPGVSTDGLAIVSELPLWRIEAGVEVLARDGMVRILADGRLEALRPAASLQTWSIQRREAAHKALAAYLPVGTPGRLGHVIAAGDKDGVIAEVCCLSQAHYGAGRLGEALAAIHEGLLSVRAHGDTVGEAVVLAEWVKVSLSLGTPDAMRRVLRELEASAVATADLEPLQELVRGGLEARGSRAGIARQRMQELRPFSDSQLEMWRLGTSLQDACRLSVDEEEAALRSIEAYVHEKGEASHVVTLGNLKGLLEYRKGNFEGAASLHLEAGERGEALMPAVACFLNAAAAYLEVPALKSAGALAERALEELRQLRHPFYEARAQWILRAVAYRSGNAEAPEVEFVEAVRQLSNAVLESQVCVTEAAVAWRCGQLDLAEGLAIRAQTHWLDAKMIWPARLAGALALACSDAPEPSVARDLCVDVESSPVPGISAQVVSLVIRALPELRGELEPVLIATCQRIPHDQWRHRREVLSIDEILARDAKLKEES
ncbi:MAG: serine/threonine-protein kinase [Planctomycetota bacterium]